MSAKQSEDQPVASGLKLGNGEVEVHMREVRSNTLAQLFVRFDSSGARPVETLEADASIDLDANGAVMGVTITWYPIGGDLVEIPDSDEPPVPTRLVDHWAAP